MNRFSKEGEPSAIELSLSAVELAGLREYERGQVEEVAGEAIGVVVPDITRYARNAERSTYPRRINGCKDLDGVSILPIWRLRAPSVQDYGIEDMPDIATQVETSVNDLSFRPDRLWTWIAPQQKPANIPLSDFFTRGCLLLMKR